MADLATAVREPQWLADRRSRAAELAASLDLPRFKGTPGWEFTSLGDVLAGRLRRGRARRRRRERRRPRPDAAGGARGRRHARPGRRPRARDARTPSEDGPVVLPLTLAVERHPELVEPYLGTIVEGDRDLFTAANDAGLDRRRVRLRPARRAGRRPDPADRDRRRRRHRAEPPHADRARRGRRGRGLGAVPVRLRGRRVAAQHRRRARGRPERASCATSAART